MMKRTTAALLGLFVAGFANGDSIVGENEILCAPGYVTHCSSGGDCETRPADIYGIPVLPEYAVGNMDAGLLLTSEASDEAEAGSSPIQSVSRENGEIYLQGVEAGRIFSAVIVEELGTGTMSIIASGESATAFLVCTVV